MKLSILAVITGLTLFTHATYGQKDNFTSHSETRKSTHMKEFSLLIRVPLTYTSEQAKAVNPKWNALINQWTVDSIYITSFAFPGDGYVITGSEKIVTKEAVVSNNLKVVSNLFIRALNIEKAIELAKACPILEFSGTVEVREIPPRPIVAERKN